jgi:hypothetical protein
MNSKISLLLLVFMFLPMAIWANNDAPLTDSTANRVNPPAIAATTTAATSATTTTVAKPKIKHVIKVYPSVITGEVIVEDAKFIQVLNADGLVIAQFGKEDATESLGNAPRSLLNINKFPHGVYVVRGMDTEGGRFSEKIIKL